MSELAVDRAVEAICERGCRYVSELLANAESQTQCAVLSELNPQLKQQVLHELSSIMSVYETSCNCDV